MDLKEIINRPLTQPMQQDESLFVLNEYVRIRKNVNISPVLLQTNVRFYNEQQLKMMSDMVTVALAWLKENYK